MAWVTVTNNTKEKFLIPEQAYKDVYKNQGYTIIEDEPSKIIKTVEPVAKIIEPYIPEKSIEIKTRPKK